jgi:fluoroacetyl-CoA thioesterase
MFKDLTEGIKGEIQTIVKKEDTAAAYGSGLVEVFATPAMIALMEKTCLQSVLEFLPDGFNTVGTEVNVKHLKATLVSKKVRCNSILQKVDGKKLLFSVEAFDEEGKIGEGTHTRYIIDTISFMEKL